MNKQALIAHLETAGQVFLSAFAISVYPFVVSTNFSAGVTKAALIAVSVAGIQAGIKALYETLFPSSLLTVTTSVNAPVNSTVTTPSTVAAQ